MFMDFRYGFIPFRFDRVYLDGAWTYNPNYGWTYPDYIPPGELTIPSDELKVNVDGTVYRKMWDSDIHELAVADAASVAELVSVDISDISIYNNTYHAPTISKIGTSYVSPAEAWDEYDAAPVEGGEGVLTGRSTSWGVGYGAGGYRAGGFQMCLVFNTTDTPTAATVKLRFNVDFLNDAGYGDPVLKLYTIDSSFSTSHWDTGAYIAQKTLSATGYHEIALSNDDINYGGITRLKCTLEAIDGDRLDTATVHIARFEIGIDSYTRLIFTY